MSEPLPGACPVCERAKLLAKIDDLEDRIDDLEDHVADLNEAVYSARPHKQKD